MKKYKNIYQTVCLVGLLGLSISSCTDWLTIYPQDRVVEENFWEDKNDLEGVRYGAYRQMAKTVSKFAIWGDLRSDSYEENSAIQEDLDTHDRYLNILSGMPDSSMTEFEWSGVYTTINFCNKVLAHGEEVLAKDKQFTTGEWIQMKAEMTALRALNYFYLIRAFKDVPFTKKVINKDSEVEAFPLTNQLAVLDSIIADCESVAGKARNRFTSKSDTKGLITNTAIYAMLADMYLWRGSLHEGRHGKTGMDIVNGEEVSHDVTVDYQKAADYADLSLQYLANQNAQERTSGSNIFGSGEETFNYGLANCDMIKNKFEDANSVSPKMEAQTAIFYTKNSRESIFELQYSVSDNLKNDVVNSLYGYSNSTHLKVNKDAMDALYNGGITGEGDNGGRWDSRLWVCCQDKLTEYSTSSSNNNNSEQSSGGSYYMMKYQLPNPSVENKDVINMDGSGTNREIKNIMYSGRSYNSWIIYRMTDVMLMKAEALACLGNSNLKKVKAICNAIHRRSYCNYKNPSKQPNTDAESEGTIGNAYGASKKAKNGCAFSESVVYVMNERQIELLGEGKRWFDLVRLAERSSYNKSDPEDPREPGITNGQYGMTAMVEQFLAVGSNSSFATTLTNRFKNRYGLYCPIYYMEVKASDGAIEQNPVWNKSKYEQ
ncbi:MAG: RagB/SusD family nutrient uptake outer membrane protein [Bacteroidaceae bacterium]|nr:RagB/SusD family nutrient uptake outer membrane protein [Bacteroidaceae bacterium]